MINYAIPEGDPSTRGHVFVDIVDESVSAAADGDEVHSAMEVVVNSLNN